RRKEYGARATQWRWWRHQTQLWLDCTSYCCSLSSLKTVSFLALPSLLLHYPDQPPKLSFKANCPLLALPNGEITIGLPNPSTATMLPEICTLPSAPVDELPLILISSVTGRTVTVVVLLELPLV